MGLFDKRTAFKPFEYPDVVKFKEGIQHSYWLVSEWNFQSDIQDFKVKLNDSEREAIKRTLLAISQIEVAVKRFWANLGNRFPKPEIEQVGVVFAESETRHSDSYSHLLEVLGLNNDFNHLSEVKAIQGRVDYLAKYLEGSNKGNEEYALTLSLFSIFVENVSLFSQFAIIKAFNKHTNSLKDIDNVVQATFREEILHSLFGAWLVNQIKTENPDWFDKKFYTKVYKAAQKAYDAESNIVDWIFEDGELAFCSKESLKEFIKNRLNDGLGMIGGDKIFEIDEKKLKPLKWFEEEIFGESSIDFFHKRPVSYSSRSQSITPDDLF